ncbi:MAG TPA: tRNA preQ1(34) S-adenosylmethionine ribosyltransferase-isomerase QueA [Verrucomicrobiae bacterium]|nr:tRNA preQ1(34) S-adenosylmethionine ribosyltransferase-isomerase QueA [Verrucomicrobiae bacterium]
MLTADFDFELPEELIAAEPVANRTDARLLVVDRNSGTWEHRRVIDLPSLGRPGDLWLLNNSKVIPARLLDTGAGVEALLLEETSQNHWRCLTTPARKTRQDARLSFAPRTPGAPPLAATVLKTLPSGERILRFHEPFSPDAYGLMPVPPYILKRRKAGAGPADPDALDRERYQTVFAARDGSVAAPTAGLHFTPELLARLPHAFVTLHVGLGTFRPIKTERLEDHIMHEERFWIPEETAAAAMAASRRIAVGTTVARVLETVRTLHAAGGKTHLFIRPPYHFRHVHVLMTNFHLPRSSLLVLVASFLGDRGPGRESTPHRKSIEMIRAIYADAIREHYRFYSYGDAMLII